MKLTTFILITVILQVSANTFGQKISLSERNSTLESVLEKINEQSGYDFLFFSSILKTAKPVTINIKNTELKDVLEKLFENQPLSYQVNSKSVTISNKKPSIMDQASSVIGSASAVISNLLRDLDVRGRVVDETGNPLSGATVTVKGTSKSTKTNAGGEFFLQDVEEGAVIVISFVGYRNVELKAAKMMGTIKMEIASSDLQEVTINKGYYTTTQKLNTGSVSKIMGDQITKQPVTNPILALQALVPGLVITQTNGYPGSDISVRIRGQNSIANGNEPLYLINGVPFPSTTLSNRGISTATFLSPFNSINPSDIESIEVLKDADATAIYGARGANGVILITTKRPKYGDTKFTANMGFGMSTVGKMLDLLNREEYLMMRKEALKNDGILTPGSTDYDLNGAWDTSRTTNWQQFAVGNTAYNTDAQFTLSSGGAQTQFAVRGGYNRQTTVLPKSFPTTNLSFSPEISHKSLTNHFNISLSGSYSIQNSSVPRSDLASIQTIAPVAPPLYDKDGSINWQNNTFFNPLASLQRESNSQVRNLNASLNVSYEVLPNLILSSRLGYQYMNMAQSSITPLSSYNPGFSNQSSLREHQAASTDVENKILEPLLSHKFKLGKGYLISMLGGTIQENITNPIFGVIASNFPNDALIKTLSAATNYTYLTDRYSMTRSLSAFMRICYDWDNKYILNLTARRDGNSRFGNNRKFGNFGSVGAAWIFSEEDLIKNSLGFLTLGKLRASYGSVGNQPGSDYEYLSSYTSVSYTYLGAGGLIPSRFANPNFQWEVNRKMDVAIELSAFKNRLHFVTNYYKNRTASQLVNYPLVAVTGGTGLVMNLPAVLENRGFELELSFRNVPHRELQWNTSLNISFPKNELVSFPGLSSSSYASSYLIGKPTTIRSVIEFTGVDPQTGLYTYKDLNANGSLTTSVSTDARLNEDARMKFLGGWNQSFTWRGIELQFTFNFVSQRSKGGYEQGLNLTSGAPGTFNLNQPSSVLARWRNPGDRTHVQKYTTRNTMYSNSVTFGDERWQNASFIRLNNVSASYNFNKTLLKLMGLNTFQFFCRSQNLFVLTKFNGIDPEAFGSMMPPLRNITFGINIVL